MATIDTSTIENFDSMTAEEKLEAVLGLDIPEKVDLSQYVSKSVFDKKASEVSALSKQLKDKMSEDELKKAEEAEHLKSVQEELEKLRTANDELVKNNKIAEFTNQYLAIGFDKDLAKETAQALAENDYAKVLENQKKHNEALQKKFKEDAINDTRKPGGNGGSDGGDDEDSAIQKAKEIAKQKNGNGKSYEDIMKNYR